MIQTGDTTNNNTLIQIGIVDNSQSVPQIIDQNTTQDVLNTPPVIIDVNQLTTAEEKDTVDNKHD